MTATSETPDDSPHAYARRYAELGLRVLPIRPGEKYPPMQSWQDAATDDIETIDAWWTGLYRHHGVGIAMGPQPNGTNLFALDVDTGKIDGYEALDIWEATHGVLPDTWLAITGSGGAHMIFSAPPDVTVRNQQALGARIAAGVDVRGQGGQIVVAPTIHPDTATPYHWAAAPWSMEVAAAPDHLLRAVTEPATQPTPVIPTTTIHTPTPAHDETPADWLRAHWDWTTELQTAGWTLARTAGDEQYWTRPGKTTRDGHSAVLHGDDGPLVVFSSDSGLVHHHQAGIRTTDGTGYSLSPLAFYAATHHRGVLSDASRALRLTRMPDQSRPTRPDIVQGPPPNVNPETGEIISADPRNLPDHFWSASALLEQIRTAAHSRLCSADAVLMAVLCRVAALTPHTLTLPPIIGTAGSLNFLAGIVAGSGAGKTTSAAIARELLPSVEKYKNIVINPAGSGEGLIDQYFEMVNDEIDGKQKPVKKQTKTSALVLLDEGQALKEMAGRQGSTTMPTLRSAWSGEMLGQANASIETYRRLPAHGYRMAVLAGYQPEYAAALIADAAGGTPQRFVLAHGIDASIDAGATWPGPIDLDPPPRINDQQIEVGDNIAATIRDRRLAIQQGRLAVDPLDSHTDLLQLKIAALLAILHGTITVDADSWDLAGEIMRASRAVRTWVIETHRTERQRAEQARTDITIQREAASEDSALRRATIAGARAIGRKVAREGTVVWRDMVSAVAGRDRKIGSIDDMVTMATEMRWIAEIDPERGGTRRWRPGPQTCG